MSGKTNPFSTAGDGRSTNTTFSFGNASAHQGTPVKFKPLTCDDTMMNNGCASSTKMRYQSISCMQEYTDKSFEEVHFGKVEEPQVSGAPFGADLQARDTPPIRTAPPLDYNSVAVTSVTSNLTELLRASFENALYTDVKVKAGQEGREIPAHKLILALRSKVFARTLHNMSNSKDDNSNLVSLLQHSYTSVREFIQYFYTDDFNKNLEVSTILEMLNLAITFEVERLINECSMHLKLNVDISSCIDIYLGTNNYENLDLSRVALQFIKKNIDAVIRNDRFLEMNEIELKKLLENKNLTCSTLKKYTKPKHPGEVIFIDDVSVFVFKKNNTWRKGELIINRHEDLSRSRFFLYESQILLFNILINNELRISHLPNVNGGVLLTDEKNKLICMFSSREKCEKFTSEVEAIIKLLNMEVQNRIYDSDNNSLDSCISKKAQSVEITKISHLLPVSGHRISYAEFGDPVTVCRRESFQIDSVPDNHIVIKMLAASINPADINAVKGVYRIRPSVLPAVPGSEGVGVVIKAASVGGKNPILEEGDWVIPKGPGFGTWQAYASGANDDFIKIPKMDLVSAATLSCATTAYRLLKDFEQLNEGDCVIQNGGNSAVGQAVIQLCREMGLKCVSVIKPREDFKKIKAKLMSMGNADTIVVTDEELRRITNDFKAQLALNCLEGKSASEIMKFLDESKTMVTYGGKSRKPIITPTGSLIFQDKRIRGYWMTGWNIKAADQTRKDMLHYLCNLSLTGKWIPPDHKVIALAKHRDALDNTMKGYSGVKYIIKFD